MNIRFKYNTNYNSCEATSDQELTQQQQLALIRSEEAVSDYAKPFTSDESTPFFYGDIDDVKAFAIATLHNEVGSHINIDFIVN